MDYRYKLEKYAGKKTRHTCPNCDGKFEFTRYIDADGNYLADDVGRCNRLAKCGYHRTPSQAGIGSNTVLRLIQPAATEYIPKDKIDATLKSYNTNTFVKYLRRLFDSATVQWLCNEYKLGTARNGSCIFWQVDDKERGRTGKVILYESNGHRSKTVKPYFVHTSLKLEHTSQCLFGLHRLSNDKPIGLVESEKTAVIMSGKLPDFTWMATGGRENIGNVIDLKGYNVVAVPDSDAYESWKKKLQPYAIKVSNALQQYLTQDEIDKGLDLADIIGSKQDVPDEPIKESNIPSTEKLQDGREIVVHSAGFPLDCNPVAEITKTLDLIEHKEKFTHVIPLHIFENKPRSAPHLTVKEFEANGWRHPPLPD